MPTRPPPHDPRTEAFVPGEAGIMPIVARPRSGPPVWLIGLGVLVAGLLLFAVLDARRRAMTAPSVAPRAGDALVTPAPPPPLYVPPERPLPPAVVVAPRTVAPAPLPTPPPAPPQVVYVPQPVPPPAPPEAPPPPARVTTDPALVVDTGAGQTAAAQAAAEGAAAPATGGGVPLSTGRVRSGAFANRSTTVVQGTLIPAVLETALDSTRPGFARAIVSRDVRGFDGTRVLIPRGSRLIGDYRSEVAPGQRRALVTWTRLIRPDGATIAIGSPAGDPLGRAGIRASVNTHFFERFAGAILQSALDIGVNLASRTKDGTVIVVPPGAQGVTQIIQPTQITPTLKVRQGTSISIFVARDLDFTGAESRR